ncbi:MAG TPA: carboxypeptidase regulatory-like domain-containing protein [Candidatus Polarisedimenticolia bacterium]|nr:carboxypeptidase regulatory-like domain-containing protein [Candidatus Polarisedimenticolia bacterium]
MYHGRSFEDVMFLRRGPGFLHARARGAGRSRAGALLSFVPAAAMAILAAAAASVPARAGDVTGRVTYAGDPPAVKPIEITKDPEVCGRTPHLDDSLVVGADRGILNVVVRVADPGDDAKPMPAPASSPALDQNACRFVPRIALVPVGTPLDFLNNDGILHNIHTWSKLNPSFNRAQPKLKKVMTETFASPELFRVTCDVHPWMTGWVVVAGHAYYAVTGPDGRFSLAGVPAGTRTLEFWHERLGVQKKQVTVPASGELKVDLTLPATAP